MGDESPVVVAIYDYRAQDETELTISKNEKLVVLDDTQNWWKVKNQKQMAGYVPSNYVKRKDSEKGDKKNIIEHLKNKMGGKGGKDKQSGAGGNIVNDTKVLGKSGSKILSICIAKFNYTALRDDELSLRKGDKILVTEKENDGWWRGEHNGKSGWFPYNYVEAFENESAPPSEYALPSDVVFNGSSDSIICKVRTLYPFNSQSSEELSFEKDELLDIIEKPKDDPDWWKARTATGVIGLVPRNYVEEIEVYQPDEGDSPSVDSQESLPGHNFANEDWFHGTISRVECEKLLRNYADNGEYLVRESESKVSSLFSIS